MINQDFFRGNLRRDELEAQRSQIPIGRGNTLRSQTCEVKFVFSGQAGPILDAGQMRPWKSDRNARPDRHANRLEQSLRRGPFSLPDLEWRRRVGFDQVLAVGSVIGDDQRIAVDLRRNAVNSYLAAVGQGILQHGLQHRVLRPESTLADFFAKRAGRPRLPFRQRRTCRSTPTPALQ